MTVIKDLLHKLKNWLKKIFIKEKKSVVEEKSLIEEKKAEENAVVEKSIESLQDQKDKMKDLYPDIVPGTIIRAKRNNHISNNKSLVGHDEGPFLVVDNNESFFICAYGTGVYNPDKKQYQINGIKYKLDKQTYINCSNLERIYPKRYISTIDKLTDYDFNDYKKKLLINKGNYYVRNKSGIEVKIDKYFLTVGDVYYDGIYYYLIVDIKDNKYICLLFKGDFNSLNNLSYDKLYKYKKINFVEVVKQYDEKYMDLIKKKYFMLNSEGNRIIKRGSIITFDQKIYYVYGEEGTDFLIFPLYYEYNELYGELQIDDQIFYADYNSSSSIPKKYSDYQFIKQLNENQMDEIKKKKKSFYKQNKDKLLIKS